MSYGPCHNGTELFKFLYFYLDSFALVSFESLKLNISSTCFCISKFHASFIIILQVCIVEKYGILER